ncbi:hypothetical protein C8R42DRAFT_639319 [Lentinula raphanica]|nr:hypothetical protein C8R42DRAFT_639319 [Lentinula raphanica]
MAILLQLGRMRNGDVGRQNQMLEQLNEDEEIKDDVGPIRLKKMWRALNGKGLGYRLFFFHLRPRTATNSETRSAPGFAIEYSRDLSGYDSTRWLRFIKSGLDIANRCERVHRNGSLIKCSNVVNPIQRVGSTKKPVDAVPAIHLSSAHCKRLSEQAVSS